MRVLIEIDRLQKAYGANVLFENATVRLCEKQKLGFIGRNGAGKSTLCRMILGQEESDAGSIIKSPDLRLSFLEQHDPFKPDETVLDFLTRYTGAEPWQCGKVAGRFQIKGERLTHTKIGALSGGYQTRVKLTAMLVREPNFLILDEPTNFLDLNTLLLLEEFFQDFNGGFLIVSHDREFLKKTCDETLEAERGKLTVYPGSVEEYFAYKQAQEEQAVHFNRNVELKQKELQTFVDRFRAKASKASQAQSKLKQLNRLEKIEIAHPMSKVRIRIPAAPPKSGVALRCQQLTVGYPAKKVLQGIDLALKRGSHIAVLGENGQGKTTFLKTIAGELSAVDGEFKWGEGMDLAYYAQHVYAHLASDQDIQTYLTSKASKEISQQEILNMAGSFLFRGDDVKKRVKVLSGGERARLVLAGLLLAKRSVLLLDEPTNHLDFETVEALAQALKTYPGTIFFISHDRTFVNLVATEILEIKNGQAGLYPGTYEEYVDRLHRLVHEEAMASAPVKNPEVAAPAAAKRNLYQERKALQSAIQQAKTKMKKLDAQIAAQTQERQSIMDELVTNPQGYSRTKQQRLEELTSILQNQESSWLEVQEEIEGLEKLLKAV